jgi:hypothetical protein
MYYVPCKFMWFIILMHPSSCVAQVLGNQKMNPKRELIWHLNNILIDY